MTSKPPQHHQHLQWRKKNETMNNENCVVFGRFISAILLLQLHIVVGATSPNNLLQIDGCLSVFWEDVTKIIQILTTNVKWLQSQFGD